MKLVDSTDEVILEWLKLQFNRQGYLKQLIRKDIQEARKVDSNSSED